MKDETVFQNSQRREAVKQFMEQGKFQVKGSGWSRLFQVGRFQFKLGYSPTGWGTVSHQGNLESYFIRVGSSQSMTGRRRFNMVFWRLSLIAVRTNPNEDPWG